MPAENSHAEPEGAGSDPQGWAEACRRVQAACRTRQEGLQLSGLGLEALPSALGKLQGLRILDLHNNRLEQLPDWIGHLPTLQELYVYSNRLTSVPASLGELSELRELYLFRNHLAFLPESLSHLGKLERLSLHDNLLERLPESLGRLAALRGLYLGGNRLGSLPESCRQLSSLELLDLGGNEFAEVPPSLAGLPALETLVLDRNRLRQLPEWLAALPRLQGLYLHGNPALELPEEVFGPSWPQVHRRAASPKPPSEILDYYLRIQGAAGQPLGECKLIVVGRGGVGKTTLIKRLAGHLFKTDEEETHGISISRLRFRCRPGTVTARVWDFGGQAVLHSMHEFFLTARSLYLLVLGERDDMLERDATYWLQLIRSYAGDAPVLVVLNKSGGRRRQFDRASLEQKYGPVLGWIATECSDRDPANSGLSGLESAIVGALESAHLSSVWRKFPSKWMAIKNQLEAMTESYLDFPAYQKLCREYGELSPNDQAALASDLHDLGVALNYGRDPRLRDTTVLRPAWLAQGIYAVLRANDLDSRHLPPELSVPLAADGVVTPASLARIHAKAEAWNMLRTQDYPEEKRLFLLQLMDSFHLSYPLDVEGTQHLVPGLLPLEPPPGAVEPADADRTRLRYEFEVVPAPLLLWFIARTFSLIPDRLHWRRGAILRFGAAHACVSATPDERYLYLTAAGPERERHRLLSIARGTLQSLFAEYRGLRPIEQWEHRGQWVPREFLEEFGLLPRASAGATRRLALETRAEGDA